MELDETGLSALANFADAVVSSPREFEELAEATIDDARRFGSPTSASALAATLECMRGSLEAIEDDPGSRTIDTLLRAARHLREEPDDLAREAGRALVWAVENQMLLAARQHAEPLRTGGHPRWAEREASRPVPISLLERR